MKVQFPGSVHNHTDYSNLRLRDSINRYNTLIDYAIELGHSVVAITEHECISNAVKVEKYYKKVREKHPNFTVILGNEIYLVRDGLNKDNFVNGVDQYFHFILLAKDAIGHQQIRELSTRAWIRSYEHKRLRRVPTYYEDLEEIVLKNKGHIIASTACLGGCLAVQLLRYNATLDKNLYQQIINWCKYLNNIFGEGNFFFEMQPSNSKEQEIVNKEILKLSQMLNIPYIITTDSHYLNKEKAVIHKAYLNSQKGDREVDAFYATTYMMNTDELESYMNSYLTEEQFQIAYNNILKIKKMCSEPYSLLKPLKIPQLKWKESKIQQISQELLDKMPMLETFYHSDYEGDRRLVLLISEKILSDKRLQNDKIYNEVNDNLRITLESSIANNTHWSSYFLNLQNIIKTCWDAGSIVLPGRGSGVGFLLLYLLDITQINPLWETTPTFSWRFLNPERVSVLDIDFDVSGLKRKQILNKMREVYGDDRVCNVATFGTEAAKNAILTACRGLNIDVDIAQGLSAMVPSERGITWTLKQCFYGDKEKDMKPIKAFVNEMTNNYPEVWKVAQEIEGIICRMGIHAGGVVFVDEPFINSTALMRAPDDTIISQFDLHDLEDVSLIKYDILSVEAADRIQTCLELLAKYKIIEQKPTLKETYENTIGIYNLERNDIKMWEMVWNHQIQSLFQMEQQSGIQGIALTKPKSVDDLATLNSVIRLMAQEKGGEQPLDKFARFKNDINNWYAEMEQYNLTKEEQEILKPILETSYGICESQERFMSLVQLPECGGFDLNWADRLRKAVAKKQPAQFIELENEYFEAVKNKKLSYNLCNYVWRVLVSTSRGYGFK